LRHGDKADFAHWRLQRWKTAGIENLDRDKVPSRMAARGGLGALMAAKGLKAVVFDHTGGRKPLVADPEGFKAAMRDYSKSVLAHPQSATYRDYGTAAMDHMSDACTADAQLLEGHVRGSREHQWRNHAGVPS
jgi:hypothetical protein